MKRIVLGFGLKDSDEPTVRTLGRLRFKEAVVDVVHAVEPPPLMFLVGDEPAFGGAIANAMEGEEAQGRHDGEAIRTRLRAQEVTPGALSVVFGHGIAAQLIDYADRTDAALITVGSHGKGPARSFFTGSVGRGLIIGAHRSLLIAKGWPAESGGIRAVFATDHSAYADRCLTTLLNLAPQGISQLTVLTAYPIDAIRTIEAFLPPGIGDRAEWVRKSLCERNAGVIQRLAPLGCAMDSRVENGRIADVLPEVMLDTDADLLILGARGHGFRERMDVGSTSLHEALTEPRSILVLRAPPPGH